MQSVAEAIAQGQEARERQRETLTELYDKLAEIYEKVETVKRSNLPQSATTHGQHKLLAVTQQCEAAEDTLQATDSKLRELFAEQQLYEKTTNRPAPHSILPLGSLQEMLHSTETTNLKLTIAQLKVEISRQQSKISKLQKSRIARGQIYLETCDRILELIDSMPRLYNKLAEAIDKLQELKYHRTQAAMSERMIAKQYRGW